MNPCQLSLLVNAVILEIEKDASVDRNRAIARAICVLAARDLFSSSLRRPSQITWLCDNLSYNQIEEIVRVCRFDHYCSVSTFS